MTIWREEPLSDDLQEIADRLRANRRDPTPLELDRLKVSARSRASSAPAKEPVLGSRLLALVLTGGLLIGGTGGVLAASGGNGSKESAAESQYCPPNEKPKKDKGEKGGNKCGQDKNKDHGN